MSTSQLPYLYPSLPFLLAFISIWYLLSSGGRNGDSFSLQIVMSQPSDVLFHLFFRNNCLTQPTSCTFSWQSRGRRERQLLCSQACNCTSLVVTEFIVSTGCQANWDFTMDKALGLPFSKKYFCRPSQFLFLHVVWQVTLTSVKMTLASKCIALYCVSQFQF